MADRRLFLKSLIGAATAYAFLPGIPILADAPYSLLKRGDVITFDRVFSVNPFTNLSTKRLQQFVITSDQVNANDSTVTFSPQIIGGGVLGKVGKSPLRWSEVLK